MERPSIGDLEDLKSEAPSCVLLFVCISVSAVMAADASSRTGATRRIKRRKLHPKMLPILQSGVDRETDKIVKHSAVQVEVMEVDAEPSGNAESGPTLTLRE